MQQLLPFYMRGEMILSIQITAVAKTPTSRSVLDAQDQAGVPGTMPGFGVKNPKKENTVKTIVEFG